MSEEEKEFFETRIPILRRHYELVSDFNGQVNEEETKKLFRYISQMRKENRKLKQENQQLKDRINKVIKYIKEQGCYEEDTKAYCDDINYYAIPRLMEILKGDKE